MHLWLTPTCSLMIDSGHALVSPLNPNHHSSHWSDPDITDNNLVAV